MPLELNPILINSQTRHLTIPTSHVLSFVQVFAVYTCIAVCCTQTSVCVFFGTRALSGRVYVIKCMFSVCQGDRDSIDSDSTDSSAGNGTDFEVGDL